MESKTQPLMSVWLAKDASPTYHALVETTPAIIRGKSVRMRLTRCHELINAQMAHTSSIVPIDCALCLKGA